MATADLNAACEAALAALTARLRRGDPGSRARHLAALRDAVQALARAELAVADARAHLLALLADPVAPEDDHGVADADQGNDAGPPGG